MPNSILQLKIQRARELVKVKENKILKKKTGTVIMKTLPVTIDGSAEHAIICV
jgi:hypothetical protein